jgi:RND family efflux transporter MFP subunit
VKKGILWTIALAVFAGGVFIWMSKRPEFFKTSSFGAPAGTKIPGQPTTAVVGHRDINFSITAAGEIGPIDTVSVRPEVGGLIAKLSLDIGDKVKKGAILFTLNDYDLQTEKSSRKTEIEGAKLAVQTQTIQLEKTKLAFDRTKELFSQKLVSQETFDNARIDFELAGNALDIAKNRLETSQTGLQTVEDKLTKTIIRAPFDCTILTRPVSIGQAVSGSSGFNSGTEVFAIANLEDMIITAHLNQADVTRLKVGQEVAVQIEAVPGLKLTGKVDRLAPQATFKNGVKGFATRIILKNAENVVRPGMTANLSIPLISAGNVLAMPLGAVFSNQGERFAWVKKAEGGFEHRPVNLGVADYDFVEVTKGLKEGDEISLVTPTETAGFPAPGTVTTKDRTNTVRTAK